MSHLLLVAMIAAQSLDISTTVIGLNRGCQEQTFSPDGSMSAATNQRH